MRIALDAMGGDHAPEQTVRGAFEFLGEDRADGVEIILVGDEQAIEAESGRFSNGTGRFEILHAPDLVNMHERPARIVKSKPNSSLVRAIQLVKSEEAGGVVSAGNTGALLSASLFVLNRIPGVRRPAISTFIPSAHGGFILCDAGANLDVRPGDLVQFAIMAQAYSMHLLDHLRPRVGLLNIGAEAGKGNELTAAAYDLLSEHVDNFVGNIEARDLFAGAADVVVCDGFVGNILLKFTEGMVLHVASWARDKLKRHPVSQLALPLMRPALKDLARDLDYEEHGGSPLLGVQGISIVCHGSSSSRAIKNALEIASRSVKEDLVGSIHKGIEAHLGIFEGMNANSA